MYHNQSVMGKPPPRWSTDRKHSPTIPVYVPPELFTVGKGQAMNIFMLRAAFADMNRIGEQKKEDEWYSRKRKRNETPVYNAKGDRVNTAQMMFKDKKMKLVQELLAASSRINQKTAQSDNRITKKIYFTKEQIQSRAYGAILGARGRTHQELQQSTGCKISLMGKGISDMLKNKQSGGEHRAGEDDAPHCHITAPNEESLRKCVERIEFIISDRKEAVEFRNEKRKEVAILNGTYREETWRQTMGNVNQPGFNPMQSAPTRNAASADSEYMRFMNEVEGKAPPPGAPAPGAFPPPPGVAPGHPGKGGPPPPQGMHHHHHHHQHHHHHHHHHAPPPQHHHHHHAPPPPHHHHHHHAPPGHVPAPYGMPPPPGAAPGQPYAPPPPGSYAAAPPQQ